MLFTSKVYHSPGWRRYVARSLQPGSPLWGVAVSSELQFFEVICPLISITPDLLGISMLKADFRCLNLFSIKFLMLFWRSEVDDSTVTGEISVSSIAMKIKEDDKPEIWEKFASSGHCHSLSQSMDHSCKLGSEFVLSNVMQFPMEGKKGVLLKIILWW